MSLTEDVKSLTVGHAVLNERLMEMDGKLDKIVKSVSGDYKRPGLVLRVDRLERTTKLSTRFAWLIISGVIAAITSVAVAAIAGG